MRTQFGRRARGFLLVNLQRVRLAGFKITRLHCSLQLCVPRPALRLTLRPARLVCSDGVEDETERTRMFPSPRWALTSSSGL